MKALNNTFLLLAAAMLTVGAASAQTVANPKPAVQGRTLPTPRTVFGNAQIQATTRGNAIDNVSYVGQIGLSNFGVVNQQGTTNVADMVQINNSLNVLGNDGYQNQIGTSNDAYMLQVGQGNYACQDQQGNRNVALSVQGELGLGGARNQNYSVQEQTGSANYGYVDQDSDRNFAHQNQTSSIGTVFGGGNAPSSILNGNFADTRQGSGASATDGQWSQVVQNGQNNRAIVRQDHP